jgi:hypothetical protein
MTQIMLDAGLAQQLKATNDTTRLCAPDGTVVGLFTPSSRLKVPFTDEEIQQAKQAKGGRPLSAILADLEKS